MAQRELVWRFLGRARPPPRADEDAAAEIVRALGTLIVPAEGGEADEGGGGRAAATLDVLVQARGAGGKDKDPRDFDVLRGEDDEGGEAGEGEDGGEDGQPRLPTAEQMEALRLGGGAAAVARQMAAGVGARLVVLLTRLEAHLQPRSEEQRCVRAVAAAMARHVWLNRVRAYVSRATRRRLRPVANSTFAKSRHDFQLLRDGQSLVREVARLKRFDEHAVHAAVAAVLADSAVVLPHTWYDAREQVPGLGPLPAVLTTGRRLQAFTRYAASETAAGRKPVGRTTFYNIMSVLAVDALAAEPDVERLWSAAKRVRELLGARGRAAADERQQPALADALVQRLDRVVTFLESGAFAAHLRMAELAASPVDAVHNAALALQPSPGDVAIPVGNVPVPVALPGSDRDGAVDVPSAAHADAAGPFQQQTVPVAVGADETRMAAVSEPTPHDAPLRAQTARQPDADVDAHDAHLRCRACRAPFHVLGDLARATAADGQYATTLLAELRTAVLHLMAAAVRRERSYTPPRPPSCDGGLLEEAVRHAHALLAGPNAPVTRHSLASWNAAWPDVPETYEPACLRAGWAERVLAEPRSRDEEGVKKRKLDAQIQRGPGDGDLMAVHSTMTPSAPAITAHMGPVPSGPLAPAPVTAEL